MQKINSLLPVGSQLGQSKVTLSPANSSYWANSNKMTTDEADKVMASVSDLVVDNYRPKFFKALYKIGPNIFLDKAQRARKGRLPQHLFRYLIDEATR